MVGSVMAVDLAEDEQFEVTLADVSGDALEAAGARASRRGTARITMLEADCSDAETVRRIVEPYDVVLGALASRIGYQTLRAVIEARRPYCDICFMPEDAWELDELAREHGVTAVVDCGVAPGMSNMLAASGADRLDECTSISIFVGGLPAERRWPFQYKAAFSPHDVIEEYTRPTRLVEHGDVVVREALSEPELLDFPGVGTLEAVNTDGLRSLAHTLDVPFMKEKTLRYPGHAELMRAFRATGLFSREPVRVGGVEVRPLDLLSALMFPQWSYAPGEADLTAMRVIVEGRRDGRPARLQWDLLDRYDERTGTTSMARTTAFPCTSVARLIAAGAIEEAGVLVPERVGRRPELLAAVMQDLEARDVVFDFSETA
jgi:saccharopine dehydrogenase-like NADP-dependent oxidoreductase